MPYDMISDFLRGMRGAMLDMYRCPDKLMAAIEKISQQTLKRIAAGPKATEFTTAFIALHRGADGFMSLKQFEQFYWPYLMKLVNALVDAGYTPEIFFEGRLHEASRIPAGTAEGKGHRPLRPLGYGQGQRGAGRPRLHLRETCPLRCCRPAMSRESRNTASG